MKRDQYYQRFQSQVNMNKSMRESTLGLLREPTPSGLWHLRTKLRQAELHSDSPIWQLLDGFHHFLVELSARGSAHELSKLATKFDIGAIGGVALENVMSSNQTGKELFRRLMIGSASESLMVLASRQYVKAFEVETAALFESAAWRLHHDLWRLSQISQPELATRERLRAIEELLAPLNDDKISSTAKALLINYLFQIVLLAHLEAAFDQS